MTKKKLFLIALITAMLPLSNVHLSVKAANVPLEVRFDDPKDDQTNPQKSPILVPEVSIDGYELTFDETCLGCELRLLDENDNVVYNTVISSSTLVLPATLSGEYELQIVQGIYCFYGDIEL